MAYIILDKYLKVCGILSLEGNGCPFYDDLRTVQIADDSGKLWNDTLQISVPYGYPQTEMMMEGYHLLKQGNDGLWYCFRINDVTDALAGSVHVKQVQALNLCIWDLAHTQVEPATLSNCTSQQAYEHCLEKSDWTIHINTYTGGSKTGETFNLGDSAQTSLQQLNTDFSSEIRAYVVVSNGQVIAKYIDITDRLGEDTGRRIEYRRNMLDITRQMVDDQLFTKLYVYGGTPSGADAPISIASANNGADFIVDDTANDLYNGGGKYLEGYTSNESIDNAYGLLTWGKSQLALCNHPKYNYTVSVAALDWKPNLGDGVDVIDFDMQPELALSARAIQLQESEANPENNQVVIGEFVEIKVVTPSDIESLQKQADQTNAIAVDAAKRASAADAKADGKSTNYRSPDAPAAADINDTWEQTTGDGDDTPVIAKFTYTADGWKETSVTQKIETIIYSKNTVFGLSVDPPANAITNDLWYRDNQDGTSTLMQYDGTNWVSRTDQAIKEVTDVVATIPQSYYSAAQPTGNIVEGSTWYKETTASDGTITYDPYKYSDGAWVPVFDATAQEAADTAAAAQETAESKTQVFYGTATPTGAKEGDVWNQTNTTDDSVAVKQYINGVWQPIQGLEGPQGPQGVQGPAGANGQPTYTWIKYATSSAGANLSDDPTGKTYIGLAYNKTTATESTTATDYQWALIQGPQGPTGATGSQGVQGPTGPQGQATYTWIKYADTPTSGMSDDPTNKQYIGLAYNKTTATESTTYSDYQWARLYDASKKRNFTSTPYTPYDIGDTWTQSGSTYYCTTGRASGSYTASDWTLQQIVLTSLASGVQNSINNAVQTTSTYKGVTLNSNGLAATAGSTTVNVDSSNGFKITAGSTTKFQVDTSGNLNMQGNITAGNISGVNLTGNNLTLAGTLNVTGSISAASEGVILNSNGIAITKGSLSLPNTQIDANGKLTTTDADITGTITVSGKAPDDSYASILKISPSTDYQPLTINAPDDPTSPEMTVSAYNITSKYTDNSDPGANNIIKASFTPEQINLSEHPDDGTANGGNGVSSNLSASSFSVIDNSYNTGLTYSQPSGLFELWKNGGIIFQAGSNGIEIGQPGSTPFIDFHGSGDIGNDDYDGRIIYQNGLMNADGCDFRTEKNLKVDGGTVYSSGGLSVLAYGGQVHLTGRHDNGSDGGNADYGAIELTACDPNGNWVGDMALGYDTTAGGRFWCQTAYNRTYSAGANMYITSSGTIGRSTSATKYKEAINHDIDEDYAEKVLSLNPASWYDKAENEALARYYEEGVTDADDRYVHRHIGLIAEEVEAQGLDRFVSYGAPDANGEREIEGIEYDRLWVLLLPIINNMRADYDAQFAQQQIEIDILKEAKDNALLEIAQLQKQLGDAQNAA